jgi:Ca2+-transporting ATPase
VDPPSPGIMERPPRSPNEKILSRGTLTEIGFVGALIAIGTLFLFWFNLPGGSLKAVTMAFTSMVIFEMVRVQSVRMRYKVGLFSNRKLLLAMAVSILLQAFVIYAPMLNSLSFVGQIFTTTLLDITDWLEILAASGAIFMAILIREKLFGSEL